jgi:hypothetical protein
MCGGEFVFRKAAGLTQFCQLAGQGPSQFFSPNSSFHSFPWWGNRMRGLGVDIQVSLSFVTSTNFLDLRRPVVSSTVLSSTLLFEIVLRLARGVDGRRGFVFACGLGLFAAF